MGNAPKKYNTLGYFNLARGLGILMIIIGHSVSPFLMGSDAANPGIFANAGYVFGGGVMAMFFMISGFGFYVRRPKKCFTTQAKMLLKPYYLVGLSVLAVRMASAFLKGRNLLSTMIEGLLPYLLGMNAENISALAGEPIRSITVMWFVMALFVGWIIYNGICRLHSRAVKISLIALCVTLGWVLSSVAQAWPFCLPMGLITVGYLSVGYQIKQQQLLDSKLPGYLPPLMLVVIVFSCAVGNVDMGAGVWKAGPLDVGASFCIGYLLLQLYARFMERDHSHPILHILEWAGSRSIWILALHAFEKSALPWYRLHNLLQGRPLISTILCLVFRICLIWMLHSLISKCKRYKTRARKPKIAIDL